MDKFNDVERLAIAQAFYSEAGKLVSTKDPASLRSKVDKGYYEKKRNYSSSAPSEIKTDGRKPFHVTAYASKVEKKSRSVQLRSDIQSRLKAIEADNGQYTAFAILNQLLDEALTKYGY